MKRTVYYFLAVGIVGLALVLAAPTASQATTLDLNGQYIEFGNADTDLVLLNGTTMVSSDFLATDCQMEVQRSGETLHLTNAFHDFTFEGTTGEKAYTLNGEKKQLSTAISEKNGKIYLPLRSVMELFGTVDWHGDVDTVAVRYDFNDYLALPTAKMSDTALRYERSDNLPEPPETGWQPVMQTADGLLYEKWNEDNELTAVGTANSNLIAPVHEGYVLRGPAYAIEDDYLYWIEHPPTDFVTTQDLSWYLYIQERKDGAAPICVDEGSFKDLQELPFGIYMLDNCDFNNGNVIWLHGDKATGKTAVQLYQHDSGETQTLDSINFGDSYMTMEVALGAQDAFWTKLHLIGGLQQYGTMKRMDLESGKTSNFSKGYNLVNPMVVGDYLIIRNKPEGHNFIPDPENGRTVSSELWVYDLKKNEWSFKVTTNLPMLDRYAIINVPTVIDETHITLPVEGMGYAYDMPVIDLDAGTVSTAIDATGTTLRYGPWNFEENVVYSIAPKGSNGTNIMRAFGNDNGNGNNFFVKFCW